jgi:hypothetical protein
VIVYSGKTDKPVFSTPDLPFGGCNMQAEMCLRWSQIKKKCRGIFLLPTWLSFDFGDRDLYNFPVILCFHAI